MSAVVVPGLWTPRPGLWLPGRVPWRQIRERLDALPRDRVRAAIAVDQALGTGKAHGSATTTLTTTATIAAGAAAILIAGRFNFTTANTMAATGGSLTWVEDVTLSSGSLRISVFRANAPAGLASGTVLTVTHSGTTPATTDCMLGATSFTGIATTGVVTATGSGNGATAAWATGSVAANNGDALIGGAFADGLTGSSTPTSPALEAFDFNDATQTETETGVYKLSVSGADTLGGTWSGAATSVCAAVAYRAAVNAARAPRPQLIYLRRNR